MIESKSNDGLPDIFLVRPGPRSRSRRQGYPARPQAGVIAWHAPAGAVIVLAVRLGRTTGTLEGSRVELRRHDRGNFELYARWYADREVWHLTSWTPAPLSRSAVERLFDDRELSPTDDSFAVYAKGHDEPIGVISLMNISEANGSADLSIIVGHPDNRRKGYGTEAIRLLLGYAFGSLGLNRVGLSAFDFNAQAISAYEKLGFVVEGRLRRAVRRGPDFHDAVLMSILRPEWEGGSPSS